MEQDGLFSLTILQGIVFIFSRFPNNVKFFFCTLGYCIPGMIHFCVFSPILTHLDLLIQRQYDAKVIAAKTVQRVTSDTQPNRGTAVQGDGGSLLLVGSHICTHWMAVTFYFLVFGEGAQKQGNQLDREELGLLSGPQAEMTRKESSFI